MTTRSTTTRPSTTPTTQPSISTLQLAFSPKPECVGSLADLLRGYEKSLRGTKGIHAVALNTTNPTRYLLMVTATGSWNPDYGPPPLVRQWKALRPQCSCDITRHVV